MSLASLLSLIGLALDIAGFLILGFELLKPRDKRRFYSGPLKWDLIGVAFVVFGFIGQFAGQFLQSK